MFDELSLRLRESTYEAFSREKKYIRRRYRDPSTARKSSEVYVDDDHSVKSRQKDVGKKSAKRHR